MKTLLVTVLGFCLGAAGLDLQAQEETIAPAAPILSSDQLNELLGPIALYPDPLVSLILPASTVPSDIVLANRFITGGGSADEVDDKPWDSSVKGLARYPDTLKWLDENLDWTSQVGDAFTEQPEAVMASIQALRAQAKSVGNLVDTPEARIVQDDDNIRVVPAEPDAIYVPSYDPEVVYVQSSPSVPLIYYSQPYSVGPWLDYDCDWHHRRLYRGEWHRGWDYHHDHDRDRGRSNQVFINNNISNYQAWHVNVQRRHNDARRREQQRGLVSRGGFQIHHPQRHDFARHKDEIVRRAQVPSTSRPAFASDGHGNRDVHHFGGNGSKGHVLTPRSLPPEVRENLSKGRGEPPRIVQRPPTMGKPGGKVEVHSRPPTMGKPGGKGEVHSRPPGGKSVPKAIAGPRSEGRPITRPHSEVQRSMPKPIARPHSEAHRPMPKAIARPHSGGSRPMPKPIARPHSQAHKASGGARPHPQVHKPSSGGSRPHSQPHASAPKAHGKSSSSDDHKRKHK